MTQADETSGKRGVNPPPIISHAPEGFAGPPGPTDEEQRRALFLANLALYVPLAVAFVLFLLIQWIDHARCSPGNATEPTNETTCSSDSSGSGGGGGGSGGGGEGAVRFGGFGAVGAWHGGGGG